MGAKGIAHRRLKAGVGEIDLQPTDDGRKGAGPVEQRAQADDRDVGGAARGVGQRAHRLELHGDPVQASPLERPSRGGARRQRADDERRKVSDGALGGDPDARAGAEQVEGHCGGAAEIAWDRVRSEHVGVLVARADPRVGAADSCRRTRVSTQFGDGESAPQDPIVQPHPVDPDGQQRAPLGTVDLGREHDRHAARQGDRVEAQRLLGSAGFAQSDGEDRPLAGALGCVANLVELLDRAGADGHRQAGSGDHRGEGAGHLEGAQVEGSGVHRQVGHSSELLGDDRHRRDRVGGTLPDPRDRGRLGCRGVDLTQCRLDLGRVIGVGREDDGGPGLHPRAQFPVVLPHDECVDRKGRERRRHGDDRDDPPDGRTSSDLDRGKRRREPTSVQRSSPDEGGGRGEQVGQHDPHGQRDQGRGREGERSGEVAAGQRHHPGDRHPDDAGIDKTHPPASLATGHPAQQVRHGLADDPSDGDADRRPGQDQAQTRGRERRPGQFGRDSGGQPAGSNEGGDSKSAEQSEGRTDAGCGTEFGDEQPPRSRSPTSAQSAQRCLGTALLHRRLRHQSQHDDTEQGKLGHEQRDDDEHLAATFSQLVRQIANGTRDGDSR